MPDQTQRIRPADYELSKIQDNLANQIDQLGAAKSASAKQIELIALLQQVRGAGTPYSVKTPALKVDGDPQNTGGFSVVIGDAATDSMPQMNAHTQIYGNVGQIGDSFQAGSTTRSGTLNQTGPVNIKGNVVATSAGTNGFIIIPDTPGAVFYTTNVGNTVANFIVMDDGSVTSQGNIAAAKNFISKTGFKNYAEMGTVYRNNVAGVVRSSDTAGTQQLVVDQPMPFAGSIVGLSVKLTATWSQPIPVYIYVNQGTSAAGTPLATFPITPGMTNLSLTFSKGTYPFLANDSLGMGCGGPGVTTNTGLLGAPVTTYPTFGARFGLIIELGA